VPVIVIVLVPAVAEALTVSVNVLVVVVGFGLNPAVTPLGRPEALKLTLPAKPFVGTTAMVLVPLLPGGVTTLLGVAVRLKSGPATVRLKVVVCVKLPDLPVIVTVAVPKAAVALAVRVKVLVEVVGFGLNPAVTPLGRPEAAKLTLPVKSFSGATVIVIVPLLPRMMVRALGDALRKKFGVPEQPTKANDPMFVDQLKAPLTFSYWSTYQNVQSSLGST
jgi:hypothetical protein